MKFVRIVLISGAALVAVALIGLAVALTPSVQTWAVRRMLASHPEMHATVGRVSAGFQHVELTNLQWQRAGATVTVPTITADMPLLSAAWGHRVLISRLVSNGWTVQLPAPATATNPAAAPAATGPAKPAPAAPGPGGAPASGPEAGSTAFAGLLTPIALPVDLALSGVELSGTIALPATAGRAQVMISGGGLAAGAEAAFDVKVDVALPDDPVNAVNLRGVVKVAMDTPRTISRVAGDFDARAAGPHLRQPVTLKTHLAVSRAGRGEDYVASLTAGDRTLVGIQAGYPAAGGVISGRWQLDLRDGDVADFALGLPLPAFAATGQGQLDTDPSLANLHAAGSLEAQVDRLTALGSSLAGIGAVRLKADVDLARRSGALVVTKTDIAIARPAADPASAGAAVATVHALQPFEFTPDSGELVAADTSRELVGIAMHGVPLAWLQPFLSDVQLSGGDLRGELVATPRAGGFSFKTKVPVAVARLSVGKAGKPLVRELDVSLGAAGDYTPLGWQAEISGLTARSGNSSVLLLDAKAGRLAGPGQPVKATGLVTVDLKALLAQPWSPQRTALQRGDATVEFVASIGPRTEAQANVTVRNLAVPGPAAAEPLPSLTAQVHAELGPEGKVTVNAPVALERGGRVSDVVIAGTVSPAAAGFAFDAQLSSNSFVIDDARTLGAILPAAAAAQNDKPGTPPGPPWAGLNGSLALQLKRVVFTGAFQMNNVTGTVHFADGAMKFDHVQAAVGEGGGSVTGTLSFDRTGAAPFALAADVALTDFDPAPLFVGANPRQPPAIEGKFTVATKVTAHAARLDQLPGAVIGDFNLTSRGGTFRGLAVNVGNLVENSSKLRSWLAASGNAITSLAGRKEDIDEITSRSQAAHELAKILSAITYDQLALVVTRDDSLDAEVKELTLISPDLRITGSGHARGLPGKPLLHDLVDLELQLRARGRPAELMKYLGVLDPRVDDLGYATCTIPVKVQGSVARLDTTELSNRLVALAVAKTGLTEKAVDWINRLRGKGPN